MLHRQFGNLDLALPWKNDEKPIFQDVPTTMRIGIVEEVDSKTYVIKVRDSQSGQRGIICVMAQPQFSTLEKTGAYNLPIPESKVIYYMDGGNSGIILGNIVKGTFDPKKTLEDGINANPGFESFVDSGSLVAADLPSDFGWVPGDQGFMNERGKIKLTTAGVLILKSSPFCYMYMLPAKQARLSHFLYDEERGIGYLKRRRSFFTNLTGASLNANYKVEQLEDIPTAPEAVIREETGFLDRNAAVSSANHQSDMDISGHILSALSSAVEVLKARAIRRTMIAKTIKVQGQRTVFSPVYKEEKRVDGTVVEQVGHLPGKPFYNLEIIKSPVGYVHIICRDEKQMPTAVFKMNAIDGSINIAANALTLSSLLQPLTIVGSAITLNATTSFEVNAPIINLNASAQLGLISQGAAQLAGAMVDINAQAAMTINAPSINSYPVPAALPPGVPAAAPAPITAGILPIIQDNSPLDEIVVD